MPTLVVTLPNRTQAALKVADNTLIYDGSNFVEPNEAQYAMLYSLPVNAVTLPFAEAQYNIQTAAYTRAWVNFVDPASVSPTDSSLESAPDPSNGQCICFVTCQGTELRYVQVSIESS